MKTNEYNQPEWIIEPLSPADIAAINQGGCESGAYMPAVTYWQANKTMAEYGDDVLDYLEAYSGELPAVPSNLSWSGMACFYLSCAIELFCIIHEHLADWEDNEPINLQ